MHISDGVLSGEVSGVSAAAALVILAVILRKVKHDDIPKIAVMTAAFFAASLIHIRIGPVGFHLVLNGLTGVVLGLSAFPAIVTALIFQSVLFQHGGITALGANSLAMGVPAFTAWLIFKSGKRFSNPGRVLPVFAFLAGGSAILLSALAVALMLIISGSEFLTTARIVFAAHIPLAVIEGVITAFIAGFLIKVKPDMI